MRRADPVAHPQSSPAALRAGPTVSASFGRARPDSVYGHRIATPRITWAGLRLALLWLGLPMMAGLLTFDLLVWAIGRVFFDACWALWCLI